jgi:hypothetical protein
MHAGGIVPRHAWSLPRKSMTWRGETHEQATKQQEQYKKRNQQTSKSQKQANHKNQKV